MENELNVRERESVVGIEAEKEKSAVFTPNQLHKNAGMVFINIPRELS